ncbi:MAG: beta-ketoacyl synthase chain length factor [Myxococcaceae bacterium]
MSVSILGLGLVAPGVEDAFRVRTLPELADGRARRLTRLERMAMVAAEQALANDAERSELALVFGTGYGSLAATAEFLDGIAIRGAAFGRPIAFQQSVHNSPAGQLSILLASHGPTLTMTAREVSGESALKVGMTLLASGRADKVLVVAADEWTESLAAGYRSFECPQALSLGEGSAAVLLGTAPGPLSVERCTLTAHPCPVLRFATREQLRPLLLEGASTVSSISLSAASEEVLQAETWGLAELLPAPARCIDSDFGFHASAGLLRFVAAATRVQASPVGSACAVHGVALGGGQSMTVVRHVGT